MNQASLELWKKRIDDRKSSGLNVNDWCKKITLPNMPIIIGKSVLKFLGMVR